MGLEKRTAEGEAAASPRGGETSVAGMVTSERIAVGLSSAQPPDRRIAVVEDVRELAVLLAERLRELAREVLVYDDGRAAVDAVSRDPVHLMVLDLALPGMNGLEVCRTLRMSANYTPILMLSGKCSELDRIVGLELGADDYMTKPFSMLELLARAKALFRRSEQRPAGGANGSDRRIRAGDLVIDPLSRQVKRAGNTVPLTGKEFDLLLLFASNPGRVYSRSQLLDLVWGHDSSVYEYAVTTHINRLRAKIEADPARPQLIATVWGAGYRFQENSAM